jgi:ATP-binding cassette subfamily B protein
MGERQILAFARALHYDPSILILDEATSSVDVETERVVQAALQRLLEGRTSLVIAHRLSTILDADRILVMHKGELREQGTHAELLAKGGIYARLYELQYKKDGAGSLLEVSDEEREARARRHAERAEAVAAEGDDA